MRWARVAAFLLAVCMIFAFAGSLWVSALSESDVFFLRAGGGSGGGGGGGGGGGSFGAGRGLRSGRGPMDIIIIIIGFFIASVGGGSVYVQTIYKGSKNSKKLLKMLEKKDSAWKYKELQKRVHDAYYLIQKSWSDMDMTPAKDVMADDLFDNFQTQLKWMKQKHQRNVLEKIKLVAADPVSVYDSDDDSLDHVWYFINGSMVDYKKDTYSNEIIDGSTRVTSFVEYWKFVRTAEGKWVLDKILQENEGNQITFTRE